MCGIAGYVTAAPSQWAEEVIHRMTDIISHRGPDDVGYYGDSFASLGHRRLSIVDLSTGQQPMFNEDGNLCIIFNGEIFNHASLRPALEAAGHRYRTKSDTETIVHAYEAYGQDCVCKFRGMFSFAVWDKTKRTLFCARDRLGIKPFYYYWDGQTFVFASEMKAILQHPSVSARFDDSRLAEYLALGYLSDDRTMFAGIRKLMPGHRLTLTPVALSIEEYWEIPPQQDQEGSRSDESWIAECRRRLEETVEMRLMSDVPLGVFLSGGVDSSAIASLMSQMVEERVKTFSVGYREDEYSELGYAATLARSLGTEHHEIVVGMDDFFAALPKLIWHEDEPIVWPSSVSLYFVSKLAAEHVKVVLTGEGADEMFGGYARYGFYLRNEKLMQSYAVVPSSVRRLIRGTIAESDLLSGTIRRKLEHTVLGRETSVESFYLDNFLSAFSEADRRKLLRDGADNAPAYRSYMEYWNAASDRTTLGRLLYADQKTYLVELLMKQDQMSMAASIESRVPFLDHTFVEFSTSVPDRLKIQGSTGKYILKKALANALPEEVISRTKMGFPTPLRAWLRTGAAAPMLDSLRDPNGFLASCLDMSALATLLARHASGRVDATDRIWRLLNLQIWGRQFVSGQREQDLVAQRA